MTTREKIQIMQAWLEGKKIEVAEINKEDWRLLSFEPNWDWKYYQYRIKPTPTYIPFTFEDREMFRGKWITNEKEGEFLITYIGLENVGTDSNGYSYQEFFENFTFLDGTPCGKLQQNN